MWLKMLPYSFHQVTGRHITKMSGVKWNRSFITVQVILLTTGINIHRGLLWSISKANKTPTRYEAEQARRDWLDRYRKREEKEKEKEEQSWSLNARILPSVLFLFNLTLLLWHEPHYDWIYITLLLCQCLSRWKHDHYFFNQLMPAKILMIINITVKNK